MEEQQQMEKYAKDVREFHRLVNQMVDASEGICKLFLNNVLEDDKHILTSVVDFVPKENYKAQKHNAKLFNFSKSMLLLLDDKEVNENWIHWSQSEKSAYFLEKARLMRENK